MSSEPKIIQINYGRTINTGDYENVRIDLTAKVEADEIWRDVLHRLRLTMRKIEKQIREDGC